MVARMVERTNQQSTALRSDVVTFFIVLTYVTKAVLAFSNTHSLNMVARMASQ